MDAVNSLMWRKTTQYNSLSYLESYSGKLLCQGLDSCLLLLYVSMQPALPLIVLTLQSEVTMSPYHNYSTLTTEPHEVSRKIPAAF